MTLKQERMSDRINEILSELLLLEVSDPALQGVTVTDVSVDPEIEYADVYVNALGEEDRQKEVMQGLKRATGFLRRELARRVKLRRAPNLNFHWDISLSRAENVERALDNLHVQPPSADDDTDKS